MTLHIINNWLDPIYCSNSFYFHVLFLHILFVKLFSYFLGWLPLWLTFKPIILCDFLFISDYFLLASDSLVMDRFWLCFFELLILSLIILPPFNIFSLLKGRLRQMHWWWVRFMNDICLMRGYFYLLFWNFHFLPSN